MRSLEALQASIDALVDLIPVKDYVVAASSNAYEDDSVPAKEKKQLATHNAKKQVAPKQAIKEATKKARKWKLDPESDAQISTSVAISQQQQEQPQQNTGGPTSIHDLRDKVKAKIADMKRMRGMAVEENRNKQLMENGQISSSAEPGKKLPTPKSRQEILEKRLKKRKDRKEEVLKKKKGEGMIGTAGAGSKDVAARLGKAALGEDTMDFSRLSFGERNGKSKKDDTISGATGLTNKQHRLNKKHHDPKSLLNKLQNDAKKLTEMATTNPEKHAAIVEKSKWDKASAMAGGEVVRDDVKLVKKTVKRLEKKKVKSHNEWKNRKDSVTKSISDRDKKREANLKARSDGKKMGVKKGSGVKKGGGTKKRAGFEGGRRK
ncbi:surfeit locus protein 6-domain-containing protein [Obelidium mucronatum]|nr:surfeit locus protein 6-domain-containing protein [Obelidium mucronatum]